LVYFSVLVNGIP